MTRSSAAPISGPAKYDPEKSILFIAKEIEMNSPSQILWEVIAEIQGSPAWNPGAANAWLNIPTRNGCRVLTEETFRSDLSYQPETFISNKRLGLPQEGFDQCEVEVETKHQRKGGSR